MIYELYSVYDKVSGVYGVPTPFVNRASAIRWFRVIIRDNEFAEPTDFELYKVGSFDTDKGVLFSTASPEFVEKGVISNEA